VFNGPEASKGAGLSCAARPAYPSVVQAVTIRLAVRQPGGTGHHREATMGVIERGKT
jgi:hypothetical protein